jgi:cysteine sulfinate desulfinase/cysteine desulfurase-like protein
MSVDPVYGLGTLRISIGRHTTIDEIDRAIECISAAVTEARKLII